MKTLDDGRAMQRDRPRQLVLAKGLRGEWDPIVEKRSDINAVVKEDGSCHILHSSLAGSFLWCKMYSKP